MIFVLLKKVLSIVNLLHRCIFYIYVHIIMYCNYVYSVIIHIMSNFYKVRGMCVCMSTHTHDFQTMYFASQLPHFVVFPIIILQILLCYCIPCAFHLRLIMAILFFFERSILVISLVMYQPLLDTWTYYLNLLVSVVSFILVCIFILFLISSFFYPSQQWK